ncbi:MAG TPA: lysophospholipid acyltransferase family protein [Anaerolineales bacterium]|nr:lysophospholipid acyltransferase family protein [Anaerolineales bacterium]
MTASPQVPATDPRDRKTYVFHETYLRKILVPVLRGLFRTFSDLQVEGAGNLPAGGPVVLAANHLTGFDMFPMQFAIPRPLFFMGKEELFRNPLLDLLIRELGAFPVRRGARDDWALRHAREVLEHGQVLGMFPEGSRSRGKGLLPGKSGAARLAISAGCPVVLMAIDGTQRIFKTGLHRTPVTISLSSPLSPNYRESPLDFTDRLMFTLAAMLPPTLRGVYAVRPKGFREGISQVKELPPRRPPV